MISSATSTVRGSCTEERQSDPRRPSSLTFFFLFFWVWGFDWKMQVNVYDTKYVTVHYVRLCVSSVCPSLTLCLWMVRGNASPKHSQRQPHAADGILQLSSHVQRNVASCPDMADEKIERQNIIRSFFPLFFSLMNERCSF